MRKVILCPSGGGKTSFMESNSMEFNGYNLVCNEHLSSSNYVRKGINMGSTSTIVPESHPLYMGWIDLFKIGLDNFFTDNSFEKSCLIYNCTSHISFIKTNYPEIDLVIVLPEEDLHKDMLVSKIDSHEHPSGKKLSECTMLDLVKENHQILSSLHLYSWTRAAVEREEYKRLAKIFNLSVFRSFTDALGS